MKKILLIPMFLIGTLSYGGLLDKEKETTKTESIVSLDLTSEVIEVLGKNDTLLDGFTSRNIHYKGQNYKCWRSQELIETGEMKYVYSVRWDDPEAWGFGEYLIMVICICFAFFVVLPAVAEMI